MFCAILTETISGKMWPDFEAECYIPPTPGLRICGALPPILYISWLSV
jgi:hypothetical protein